MGSRGAAIAARLDEWGHPDLPVEREVFGSAEPEEIAAAVDAWCRAHLGAGIARYEFFNSSSGSVHGVVLADGRSVVVKGHRRAVSREYLAGVVAVQADLAASGYPAPRPLAGPVARHGGHVTAEQMLDRSPGVDAHDPGVRTTLAAGLARFIALSRAHRDRLERVAPPDDRARRCALPDTALAPVRFRGRVGCRVDRRRSRPGRGPGCGRRPRWRGPSCTATGASRTCACATAGSSGVYDWDSVHVDHEVAAVATAATTFSVDWNQPAGDRFPRPREIGAFVAEYEAARGTAFSVAERDVLAVTMVASLAYGARCEHAVPDRPPVHDAQRGLLAELGDALLEDGLDALSASGGTGG